MQAQKFLTAAAARFRFLRFALVGVGITAVDFLILNILILLFGGTDPSKKTILLCNTVSATIAAVISFFFNKHFVFQAKHTPTHFMIRFLFISLTGLYILQNFTIGASVALLEHPGAFISEILEQTVGLSLTAQFIALNAAKLLGTAVTLVWNYSLYKRFVFKTPPSKTSKVKVTPKPL